MQSHAIKLKYSHIKVSRLIEVAFAPFTEQYSQKNIAVEFNMPYTLPMLYSDTAKIAWVLTIFFSNAIRYTPDWGRLVVKGSTSQLGILITVENSGYGVPLERLQRMFERNENYDSPEFGQGLALLLAQEIVQAHGGRIGADSQIGVMTRFYIDLPSENQTEDTK